MKKIGIIIIGLVLIGFIAFNICKDKKAEREENLIQEKFAFFKNGEIKDEPQDKVEKYFNNLLILKKDVDSLEYKKVNIEDLENIEKKLDVLQENIKINLDCLNTNIDDVLIDYDKKSKEEIKEIYNESEIVKKKEEYKTKLKEYQDKAKNDINLLNYLNTNKDKYYLKDNTLIYKDENVKKKIESVKTDITLKKETIVSIPILMYHGVLDKAYGAVELFVKVSEFEEQMKYLKENNYTPIFLSEIGDASKYDKPILITFDDGYKDVYTNAYPILKKYNLKSNLYIITDWVGGEVYVNWDEVKALDASNIMEIGSHTRTHKNLGKLNEKEVEDELKGSKEILEKNLNKKINTLAYPYGGHNKMVMGIASKYYDFALSTNSGKEISNNLNKYELNRYYIYRGMPIKTFISYVK